MSVSQILLFFFSFVFAASQGRFIPNPPTFNGETARSKKEAQLQDLTLFEPYLNLNKTYSVENKLLAKQIVDRLKRNAGKTSDVEFLIDLHKAVALGDNAHSEGRLGLFAKQFGSLPFRGYWFDSKYYIIRVDSGYESLLGAQVTHIGDHAIEEIALKLKVLSGGPLSFFKAVAGDNVITNPAVLKHFNLIDDVSQISVKIIQNATFQEIVVKANQPGSLNNPATAAQRLLYPDYKFSNWTHVINSKNLPLYLRGDKTYQFVEDQQNNILYLQFRSNRGNGIEEFIRNSQQKMTGKKYRLILVDMRKNTGGNFTLTHQFFKNLGNYLKTSGKMYVLTSEITFSAGIVGVAFLKYYWPEKVRIIGERLGDRDAFWAELRRYALPNTQMKITYSDALHDLTNPDSFNTDTYYWWYKQNVNPVVESLDPDIHVVTTFEDYREKRDPVMERIRQLEQIEIIVNKD